MLFLLLSAACTEPPEKDTGPVAQGGFAFSADDHVALPFMSAGDPATHAALTLTGSGRAAEAAVTFEVEGDFVVEGETGPLGPDEARQYTVRYIGDTSAAGIALGAVTARIEDKSATTTLAAVVGDADLPATATWINIGWGSQTVVALPSAPYTAGDSPYDDASVFVFVPEGFTDRDGVSVVTHLHGWGTEIDEFIPTQRLAEQLALSGRDAILIAPQGPVQANDGDFGALMDPGGHAALVRDVLAVLYREDYVTHPVLAELALTAHSGGYLATAAILDNADLPVSVVHLFDALYGESDTFAAFVDGGGVLRSAYTATGGTDAENAAFADTLLARGVSVGTSFADDALLATSVTIGPSDATHSGVVRDERAYARWLAASGLPHRPSYPPEIVSTVANSDNTVVTWRADPGAEGLRYRVEGSDNGVSWGLLTDTGETTATVAHTAWIRVATTDVRYGDSEPSDVYGATGTEWLIVDAFDRALDGSYDYATHTFAADLGASLAAPFSVASNEAVATGSVDLSAFPRVFWMLGDEGLNDRTFSAREMDAVAAYVDAGGTLVVSGSEVGYATDPAWLADTLHATFVADDAGTTRVEDWTVGDAYDEDFPDVLAGDETIWAWETGDPAAVGWDGRVVVIGFGLENLSDAHRASAFASLLAWLD